MSDTATPKNIIVSMFSWKLLKYAFIVSMTLNAGFIAEHGLTAFAAHKHWVRAEFLPPTLTIGGGTQQRAEAEQQLAALSNALPINAITPMQPKTQAQPPRPQEKPTVHQ